MSIAVGTIVSMGASGQYGQVVAVLDHWRHQGERKLHHVRYVDRASGQLMICPDVARCRHHHTCPIHGANRWAEELAPFPDRDLDWFVAEGMLAPELAAAHCQAQRSPPTRR